MLHLQTGIESSLSPSSRSVVRGNVGIILYYRGISLLNIPGKVFAGILNVRLLTDNRLLEEQVGFRSGRGCVDHLCDKAVGGKAFGEKEEGVHSFH